MMAVVGTGVGRVVNEQMQLGKHTIPKGTILWAPIQAIQSSPTLWDKPDSFMPVRGLSCCTEKISMAFGSVCMNFLYATVGSVAR